MNRPLTIALPVPETWATPENNYFSTLAALGARGVAVDGAVDPSGFDGLLLPGGGDLNPALYHCPNMGSEPGDDALDRMQMAALDAFVKAEKPVFGICRGHQLINVYFGGTLIQDLAQAPAHSRCGGSADKVHDVRSREGSLLYALYGARFPVNSAHHQGIERLGKGLVATQWAGDGVIEAMEHASLPVFGVQWHPERMCLARARKDTVDGSLVIRRFLEMCGEKSKKEGRRVP
ncbi:MAG: gamma-glutamyl-gamma-aminobutyrate hydrolase family protein [Clostridia bacterium]|nr:gamma-glutamyl-gamma-aminobutyrate hydrolase family protein [Clostridia bacterium]